MIKFEFDKMQQERYDAWLKYHWEVHHAGFRPREMSGYAADFIFGRTGCGDNVTVRCVWCNADHPGHEVVLTTGDDGDFIYEYDADWKRLPASWETKKDA